MVLPLHTPVLTHPGIEEHAPRDLLTGSAPEAERQRAVDEFVPGGPVRRAGEERAQLRWAAVRIHTRRDVDDEQVAHQVGVRGRQRRGGQTAERMAHHQLRPVGPALESRRHVGGEHAGDIRGIISPGRVAVPGQVDRQRRDAGGQHHRVPRVGVQARAVQERHGRPRLGVLPSEGQRRQGPAVGELQPHAFTVGKRAGDPGFGGLGGQERELVGGVAHALHHAPRDTLGA